MWHKIFFNSHSIEAKKGNVYLIKMPYQSQYTGYSFWHPKKLVRERDNKGYFYTFSFTDEWIFKLKKYSQGRWNRFNTVPEKEIDANEMLTAFDDVNNHVHFDVECDTGKKNRASIEETVIEKHTPEKCKPVADNTIQKLDKKNPISHQSAAKDHLLPHKVGALFMEAGTGKTRVACELVNAVPDIDLIVYIAPLQTIKPKGGLHSVIDEINKWGGFIAPVEYMGVETISQSDKQYLQLRNRISKAKNCFIVVDESLKIKNATAKRTKRILDLSKMAQYKLILNGTPLSKNLFDLKPQMDFLSPKILNMSNAAFMNTFCKYTRITKYFGVYKGYTKEFITGYENIDYLYSLIRHYIYECDLSLNISQYYNTIRYRLDDESAGEYYRLKEKYLNNEMLMWKKNNIFLEMTQKMQHVYCCTESKFELLNNLFKEIDESRTIIFCKYIDSQRICKIRFPKATVLSYQKESLGLNLQHLCNTIYFDKIWDYALRIQSGRRTFRTGQEYDCRYWDLTGNVGLEDLIDKNIEKKIGITEYFKSISGKELQKLL